MEALTTARFHVTQQQTWLQFSCFFCCSLIRLKTDLSSAEPNGKKQEKQSPKCWRKKKFYLSYPESTVGIKLLSQKTKEIKDERNSMRLELNARILLTIRANASAVACQSEVIKKWDEKWMFDNVVTVSGSAFGATLALIATLFPQNGKKINEL